MQDRHENAETADAVAAASAGSESLERERRELEWAAMFNISLYEDLEKHYARLDTVFKVAIALFGTYSFVTLFVDAGLIYKACGALVAVMSIVTLVVDFNEKRVRAKNQRIKYSEILTDSKFAKSLNVLEQLHHKIDKIAEDDLPTNDVCDSLAANLSIDRLGLDPSYKAKINSFVRLTRYVFPWGKTEHGHR